MPRGTGTQRATIEPPVVNQWYSRINGIVPPQPTPAGWLEVLERSEAQLVAGEAVSGNDVIRELHASVARMEAKRAAK